MSFVVTAIASETTSSSGTEYVIDAVLNQIPSYAYGGAFIDDQGNYIVKIKENTMSTSNVMLPDQTQAAVTLQQTKYSLAELETMKDSLIPYMAEYCIAVLDANEVTGTVDIQLYQECPALEAFLVSLPSFDESIARITVLSAQTVIASTVAS